MFGIVFYNSFLLSKIKNTENIFNNQKLFPIFKNKKHKKKHDIFTKYLLIIFVVFTYFLKVILRNNYTNI